MPGYSDDLLNAFFLNLLKKPMARSSRNHCPQPETSLSGHEAFLSCDNEPHSQR